MPPLDHQDRLTKDNDISQASIHSRCADSPTPLNVFYDSQVAAGRYEITRNRFAPGKDCGGQNTSPKTVISYIKLNIKYI